MQILEGRLLVQPHMNFLASSSVASDSSPIWRAKLVPAYGVVCRELSYWRNLGLGVFVQQKKQHVHEALTFTESSSRGGGNSSNHQQERRNNQRNNPAGRHEEDVQDVEGRDVAKEGGVRDWVVSV